MSVGAASDAVAANVRERRKRQGMTVAQLAARCAEFGRPKLTAQVLYKMEGQREAKDRPPRPVTVDELLVLSRALNVSPAVLCPELAGPASGHHHLDCCEVCDDRDPPWEIVRVGDVVVTWACDNDLATVCDRLQRDFEITELSVRNFRKRREWAGIGRALNQIAGGPPPSGLIPPEETDEP